MSIEFEVLHRDPSSGARVGHLKTPHGEFDTPIFMPVGTQGTVKAMSSEELEQMGAPMLLVNTYHLHLRPGEEIIKPLGGVHGFMSWSGGLLSDSGGFQLFSLPDLRRISDAGVEFQSHIDGSRHFFSPEKVMEIEAALGTDIAMCLDECVAYPSERKVVEAAVERTYLWAKACRAAHSRTDQAVFGIVQGGWEEDLRRRSAEQLVSLDFPGYALGGLSVGESREEFARVVKFSAPLLPEDKPRYLMGVGTPLDFLEGISAGIDMFDCVMPTRAARNATLFTWQGRLAIRRAEFKTDPRPIDEHCQCAACRRYSRAYLRHLFIAKEILAARLATTHNLYFFLDFMRQSRRAIAAGQWPEFKQQVMLRMETKGSTEEPTEAE